MKSIIKATCIAALALFAASSQAQLFGLHKTQFSAAVKPSAPVEKPKASSTVSRANPAPSNANPAKFWICEARGSYISATPADGTSQEVLNTAAAASGCVNYIGHDGPVVAATKSGLILEKDTKNPGHIRLIGAHGYVIARAKVGLMTYRAGDFAAIHAARPASQQNMLDVDDESLGEAGACPRMTAEQDADPRWVYAEVLGEFVNEGGTEQTVVVYIDSDERQIVYTRSVFEGLLHKGDCIHFYNLTK